MYFEDGGKPSSAAVRVWAFGRSMPMSVANVAPDARLLSVSTSDLSGNINKSQATGECCVDLQATFSSPDTIRPPTRPPLARAACNHKHSVNI